jgi:hypothetical protein
VDASYRRSGYPRAVEEDDMSEPRSTPEEDEPILLEHETVLDRIEAHRRRTATAEVVDLTGATADVVVLPEAETRPSA